MPKPWDSEGLGAHLKTISDFNIRGGYPDDANAFAKLATNAYLQHCYKKGGKQADGSTD